ncbi:MAG: hypothetical protein FD163_2096 [Hyphomonadaceae bacterium]|nr:MAG: hypothetical protein FD128_682 [Hyphomonadaceae bacterium]KAF0183902.1 MAG: hypothetical protein FD163_2096 [Hyphomonadaceae bacterium]
MTTKSLFTTKFYRAPICGKNLPELQQDLRDACAMLETDDKAGRKWCKDNAYRGYTSYASLNDLDTRFSCFGDLKRRIDKHVAIFAAECHFDLQGRKLVMDSYWVNILPPLGLHTSHIHPHSVVSGTFYLDLPVGASALKIEDPRLGLMMAAPPRLKDAPEDMQTHIFINPSEGDVMLWESWLRHEVVQNQAKTKRISISFNYNWL